MIGLDPEIKPMGPRFDTFVQKKVGVFQARVKLSKPVFAGPIKNGVFKRSRRVFVSPFFRHFLLLFGSFLQMAKGE